MQVVRCLYFLSILLVVSGCMISGNYTANVVKHVRSDSLSTVYVDFRDSTDARVPICWVTVDQDTQYHVIDTVGIKFALPPGKHKFEALCFMYFKERSKNIKLEAGDSLSLSFHMLLDNSPLY